MSQRYEDEIEILEMLRILFARKWLIIAASLVCGLLAFTVSELTPEVYEAAVLVEVSTVAGDAVGSPVLSTIVAKIQSPAVVAEVVEGLGLEDRDGEQILQNVLRVEIVEDTSLLRVTARCRDPAGAGRIADEFVRQARAFVADSNLERVHEAATTIEERFRMARERLLDVDEGSPASRPERPSAPGEAMQPVQEDSRLLTPSLLSELARIEAESRLLDEFVDVRLRQPELHRVAEVTISSRPVSPRSSLNVSLGLVAGLVVSILVALILGRESPPDVAD